MKKKTGSSNTGENRKKKKPGTFKKGDPRINRKGRPKHFDEFRALAIEIARETAKAKGIPVLVDGKKVTVAEIILRQWAQSPDPRKQAAFVEYAYGKVPQKNEVDHQSSDGSMSPSGIKWIGEDGEDGED